MALVSFRSRMEAALRDLLEDQAVLGTPTIQGITWSSRSTGEGAAPLPLVNVACTSARTENTAGAYYRCEYTLHLLSPLDPDRHAPHEEILAWLEEQLLDHGAILSGLNLNPDLTALSAYLDSIDTEDSDRRIEDRLTYIVIAHPF